MRFKGLMHYIYATARYSNVGINEQFIRAITTHFLLMSQ